MECQSLRESGKEIKVYNVAHFGASCDAEADNKKFADKLELDFPLLSDTDRSVATRYGILGGRFSNRVTVFVDKEGKIAHLETKVNVREAGKQVVDKLKELKVELVADVKTDEEKSEADKSDKTGSKKKN